MPSISRLELSASLKDYLLGVVGLSSLLATASSEGAVVAVTFGGRSVIDFNRSIGTEDLLVNGPSGEIFGSLNIAFSKYSPNTEPYYGVASIGSMAATNGVITFFNNGFVNSLATAHNGGDLYLRERYVGFYHGYDTDQLNKNIAFRTGSDNLGYANVSWFVDSKSLVINSAYLETVIDAPITVGDTGVSAAPEPSRALLALVGLGGVALRRRRKQAA